MAAKNPVITSKTLTNASASALDTTVNAYLAASVTTQNQLNILNINTYFDTEAALYVWTIVFLTYVDAS